MSTTPSEFRSGWPLVVASGLGVGVGVAGLLTYNSGLFVLDLQREFGLSRTAFGAAFFGSTVALSCAMPIVGKAVDRFGPRSTAVFGALMLSLGFLSLAYLSRSTWSYALIMVLIGALAASSSPIAYARAVSAAFSRSRGLALGLVQVGIGLAAAIVPPLVTLVIGTYGWRSGFLALAAIAAVGLLPSILGLPKRGRSVGIVADATAYERARRSRTFRIQLAAFATMAFAFAGMLAHFVPMLRDAGLTAERAGGLASLIGMSVIVSRVIVGWLADRIEASWLAAASCGFCAAGCLALWIGGPSAAKIGAIALGAAMGAEADLIGFMTARHFPLAAYSRAYASQYGAFMLAAGLSPLWVGIIADRTAGYDIVLLACAGLLLIPICLFLLLPASAQRERSKLLHEPKIG